MFGVIAVLVVLGYLSYQLSYLVGRPSISISNPRKAESQTRDNTLVLEGSLTRQARLSVNNRPVDLDQDKSFSIRLYLSPGLNTIDVTASNLTGKTVSERRYITYIPN